MTKNIKNLILVFILLASVATSLAQGEEPLTQEKFAVELVKNMGLQKQLPVAALPSDCVALLESLGIAPLKGWDRKALITEDDYTVILAKALGKEDVVHIKAAQICHSKVEIINERWKENNNLTLVEFLKNENIFPESSPQCPYGLKYEDKDGDNNVDHHYHPVVFYKR
ncbi:MAG: hypothetical protein ABH954_05280 [Candidatus Omnitrophota bacterium]